MKYTGVCLALSDPAIDDGATTHLSVGRRAYTTIPHNVHRGIGTAFACLCRQAINAAAHLEQLLHSFKPLCIGSNHLI